MEPDSQLVLLERARRGDREALGQLLDELRPYVRVLVRTARNREAWVAADDSDLIQDALLQASTCAKSFQGNTLGEWLAWLRTVTLRSTYRTMTAVTGTGGVLSDFDLATVCDRRGDEPSAGVLRHENSARMALALSHLPEDMQQVLLGRLVDDLDHADLADRLGRSVGAVRMLYLRALRRLREVWTTEFSSQTGTPT